MDREIDLLGYLPQYVQDYDEIQKIMEAEDPEFRFLAAESGTIRMNQFIESCDAAGISRFEDMLGILPSSEDSLETRIARVLLKWNDSLPYTWKKLLDKLDTLCGSGNYEASRDLDEHTVYITSHLDKVSVLEELLYYMLPCNLMTAITNILNCDAENVAAAGGGVSFAQSFYITDQEGA